MLVCETKLPRRYVNGHDATLCYFTSATQALKPGAVVVNSGGKECGKLRSVCGDRALGLLRIDDVVGRGKMDVRVDDSKVADADTCIPSWWPTTSDAVVQHAVMKNEKASKD